MQNIITHAQGMYQDEKYEMTKKTVGKQLLYRESLTPRGGTPGHMYAAGKGDRSQSLDQVGRGAGRPSRTATAHPGTAHFPHTAATDKTPLRCKYSEKARSDTLATQKKGKNKKSVRHEATGVWRVLL